ncbi:MAG: tetratricopeptide repeat protein [Ardenticatenaceae bacterium]|nr:tetratricopeptide repeat protein [Ardenticatenaceae bacterium]
MMQPLIPQFILEQYQQKQYQGHFAAAALFIDISGFTSLTETLIRHEKEGAETLTGALAAIFNPLVQQVWARGGIIPLFAGDAFTAVFPLHPQNPQQTILDALSTACRIQADFADHHIHTNFGSFAMGIKIGFAQGQVEWGIPHHNDKATFYFRGEAINNCAHCQQMAATGEIIIDQSVLTAVSPYSQLETLPQHPTYHKLQSCSLETAVSPPPFTPPTREMLRPFVPDTVLNFSGSGEFREICPIFIAFQEPDTAQQLHTFINTVLSLSQRYGGTLSQLDFGDKGSLIILWFGAPMTYENNIERAAQCLLALQTANKALAHPVQWQAGMTFGIVWAGIRGGSERSEYGAVGDVVNLAARIATRPHWGEIWVSQAVYERTKNAYIFAALGPFQFKGKRQETNIYQLIQPRQTDEIAFHTERMMGRQTELAALHEYIEPLFNGRCAPIITIHGEAGIGKTRLLHELRQQLSRDRRLSWFHCPAEEILRQSLNPFKHFLSRYFEQTNDRDPLQNQTQFNTIFDTLLQRIQHKPAPPSTEAQTIAQELQRTRSILAALIGIYTPNSLYEQLEPKLRFQNSLVALKNLLLAESLLQPLIIELEDAHWLDEDSQEFLHFFTRNIQSYPIAILCAVRYGDDGRKFQLNLDPHIPQQEIDLAYLSPIEVQAIAEDVVGGELEASAVQFLMQKCNGNPFFVEQVSLDLKERGLLAPAAHNSHYELLVQRINEVPSNINAVLIARLDRLTAEVKQVVQTAAVLGREFELLILGHMLQNDTQLTNKVKTAEQAQIWATLNNIRYIFKHALLRDSAYDMQLRARLRELHGMAGKAIEDIYHADLAAHYADLAYHYDRADMIAEAARWYRLAGLQATARFANEEALTYLNRALSLIPEDDHLNHYTLLLAREQIYSVRGNREAQFQDLIQLGSRASALNEDRRRVEVAVRLTGFAFVTGDYAAAIAAAKLGVTLAQETKHRQGEAEGYLLWGRALWRRGLFEESLPRLEKALALARSTNLKLIEADALRNLGIVFASQGNFQEAENHSKRALQIYRQLGNLTGEDAALNNLGEILREQGDFVQSGRYYQQALQISLQTGSRESESVLRHSLGRSAIQQGLFMPAIEELERGLSIDQEIGDLQGEGEMLAELGNAYLFLGQYERARGYYEGALQICGEIGDQQVEGFVLAHLGLLFHRLGDTAVSWEYNLQALRLIQDIGDSSTEATALTYLGHVMAGLNQPQRAAGYYRDALVIRRKLQQTHRAIEPMAGLAQTYLAQKKLAEALVEAREIWRYLQQKGLVGIQEPFHVCLICYEVLQANGEGETAVALLNWAYEHLQNQANQLDEPTFRATFLHQITAHQKIIEFWHSATNNPRR